MKKAEKRMDLKKRRIYLITAQANLAEVPGLQKRLKGLSGG